MKILVVTTGGTINSKVTDNVIDVEKKDELLILSLYKSRFDCDDICFDVKSACDILSENISKSDYESIVNTLYFSELQHYDGVIITHGSDTLEYTAALISLLDFELDIPIAIVASNKVLSDKHSNGLENFSCAVELIRQNICGVFVPYKNRDGVMYVHNASQLLQADSVRDDFLSAHCEFAQYHDGEFEIIGKKSLLSRIKLDSPLSISKDVLLLFAHPLIRYSRIALDKDIAAVLEVQYHSGTSDVSGDVESFITRCRENDIDIYITSLKENSDVYSSAKRLLDLGARALYDVSVAHAYMKLLLLYNTTRM